MTPRHTHCRTVGSSGTYPWTSHRRHSSPLDRVRGWFQHPQTAEAAAGRRGLGSDDRPPKTHRTSHSWRRPHHPRTSRGPASGCWGVSKGIRLMAPGESRTQRPTGRAPFCAAGAVVDSVAQVCLLPEYAFHGFPTPTNCCDPLNQFIECVRKAPRVPYANELLRPTDHPRVHGQR